MPDDAGLLFAEKLLGLLDSGRFTATYKFAALIALVDVCVENVTPAGVAPEEVSARAVGERVLELLWRQAAPYHAVDDNVRFLRHSTQAADLVTKIVAFRERHGLLNVGVAAARLLQPREFARLEDEVAATIIRMPLAKLQRFKVGATFVEDRFLFDFNWPDEVPVSVIQRSDFDDTLRLKPGVGEWLVRLAGLLRPIIQQRWASFVADRSRDLVEESFLDEFLFGASRSSLLPVRGPLHELQRGCCFYCRRRCSFHDTEVDHFVPWARHPDNNLANLVVADRRCNNAKRDSLAAVGHLDRWLDRFRPSSSQAALVREMSEAIGWPAGSRRTIGAARAAYLWLPADTLLWLEPGAYERSSRERVALAFNSGVAI